jgi:hypothetical protein
MDADCVKGLFAGPIAIDELEECVGAVLKTLTQINSGAKVILKSNGTKVGYLTSVVPIGEIKVLRYWQGALGIKTELSYQGQFVGVLLLRK